LQTDTRRFTRIVRFTAGLETEGIRRNRRYRLPARRLLLSAPLALLLCLGASSAFAQCGVSISMSPTNPTEGDPVTVTTCFGGAPGTVTASVYLDGSIPICANCSASVSGSQTVCGSLSIAPIAGVHTVTWSCYDTGLPYGPNGIIHGQGSNSGSIQFVVNRPPSHCDPAGDPHSSCAGG